MRLICDVEVSNRLLPSFNMRSNNKLCRAQISIGKKPGADRMNDTEIYIMICTKQDRNGSKYRLKRNIEQMFTRFINEGKATLRFVEPPIDLCLSKADAVQLKSFLSVVKLGCQGKELDKVTLSTLAPASLKQVEKMKTKLSIASKKDYPITTNFPSGIEVLIVNGIALKKVDSRMLNLQRLKTLDLSNNNIKTLPDNWNRMENLAELRLVNNQIEFLPKGMCTGNLSKSLRLLDLKQNQIKGLGPFFCQLTSLVTLLLDDNEISALPTNMFLLSHLRTLKASNNKLVRLPASFTQFRLDTLDLYGNSFLKDDPSAINNRLAEMTLLEKSARAMKKYRVHYTEEDLPGYLLDYLRNFKMCLCGNYCFQIYVLCFSRINLQKIATSVTLLESSTVPCEAYLCSQKCYESYQKNPNSTILR